MFDTRPGPVGSPILFTRIGLGVDELENQPLGDGAAGTPHNNIIVEDTEFDRGVVGGVRFFMVVFVAPAREWDYRACTVTLELLQMLVLFDANAARGSIARRGLCKVRHLDVDHLWLQQQQARRLLPLRKVDGTSNIADLLAKHVNDAGIVN